MQYDLFSEEVVEFEEVILSEWDRWDALSEWIEDNREQVEPFDLLALEYKKPSTGDRRRGVIYNEVIERFRGLVVKKLNEFCSSKGSKRKYYFDEGMSIWVKMVGDKLNKWNAKGDKHPYLNFLAYLYPYANRGVVSELNEKHCYKDGRYTTTDSDSSNADTFNSIGISGDNFRAYESSLMSSAFNECNIDGDRDFSEIINEIDIKNCNKEIGGYYDARNSNLWETMQDSSKHERTDQNVFVTPKTINGEI